MFAMCHYERNVSLCFPICLAAGHHMDVEKNIEHSTCLPGKINKSHTLSLSGMDGKYPKFQLRGQRSPCHPLLEQDQMPREGQVEENEWE